MCFSGGASAAGGCRSRREFCFGGASRVRCSCWFCCWWSAVGRAACCGALAVLAARWCVAFVVVLGRFSRSCVVSAALVPWLVSVSALVVGSSVVSVPGCFLGVGSVVAVALCFLVPVVVVGVVALLSRVAAAVVRSLGRSGLACVARCASRAGVCPVSRLIRLTFFAALPFFCVSAVLLAANAAKCGYRRRNAAAAAETRLPPQEAPPPITPRPLSPKGKEGARSLRPPLRRGRGPLDWKIGFRPFPPIITGGQAPIFPDLKAISISDGGKIAWRQGALTSPVPDRDATGESPKNERRKNHEIRP